MRPERQKRARRGAGTQETAKPHVCSRETDFKSLLTESCADGLLLFEFSVRKADLSFVGAAALSLAPSHSRYRVFAGCAFGGGSAKMNSYLRTGRSDRLWELSI